MAGYLNDPKEVSKKDACPHCGYCPHCGRYAGPKPTYPWPPDTWQNPFVTYTPLPHWINVAGLPYLLF